MAKWLATLVEAMERHPVRVQLGGGVANIFAALGIQDSWSILWHAQRWSLSVLGPAVGWTALAVTGLAVPAAVTYRHRMALSRRASTDALQKLLEVLAETFGHGERHIRVNVMVCTHDRKRRRVVPELTFNMDNDADRDLEMDFGAGASGIAAREGSGIACDLRKKSQNDWGLYPGEKAKVRTSLKTIFTAPIFHPDKRKEVIGTLQVDSDETLEGLGFKGKQRPLLNKKLSYLAKAADIVALHITTRE